MSSMKNDATATGEVEQLGSESLPEQPTTLWAVFGSFKVSELFRIDLALGLCGLSGGLVLGLLRPGLLLGGVPALAGLIGVVIGVVLATTALIAAFLNPTFLRKLRAIDEDPVDYIRPYLFTGLLAVVGSLGAIALAVTSVHAPRPWLASAGAVTGFASVWSLASLIPNLTNLVRFMRLQQDAAEVPDDHPAVQPGSAGRRRSA